MAPKQTSSSTTDYVGKILVYTEMATIKKAASKSWGTMIEQGGSALLLAQMRALSNTASRKADETRAQKASRQECLLGRWHRLGRSLHKRISVV